MRILIPFYGQRHVRSHVRVFTRVQNPQHQRKIARNYIIINRAITHATYRAIAHATYRAIAHTTYRAIARTK